MRPRLALREASASARSAAEAAATGNSPPTAAPKKACTIMTNKNRSRGFGPVAIVSRMAPVQQLREFHNLMMLRFLCQKVCADLTSA